MEKLVPAGHPNWDDIANAAKIIPRGTPKWVVKMKLGVPAASGPKEWHYTMYGRNIAEAHVFFDEQNRVKDVQTSTEKEFHSGIIIRRSQ